MKGAKITETNLPTNFLLSLFHCKVLLNKSFLPRFKKSLRSKRRSVEIHRSSKVRNIGQCRQLCRGFGTWLVCWAFLGVSSFPIPEGVE